VKRKQLFVQKPFVYLITEGKATPENFLRKKNEILRLIKNAVEAKISLVQIREKHLTAKLVFELASEAAKITRRTATGLLVNDRADIALAARADGVQLTSCSLSTEIIRASFPPAFIIGVSTHNLEEAADAKRQGADFITFSPIFSTPTKEKYGAPQGLKKLREVCDRLNPFLVVALGGIDENNYASVLENGASGFAAIRFLNDAKVLKKLAAKK
jgi:thiamine-phosphate pyrophosphorylase